MNILIPITFTTYQAYFSLTTKKFPIGNILSVVNNYAIMDKLDKISAKPHKEG